MTRDQSNSVLDLVEQCRVVACWYWQKAAFVASDGKEFSSAKEYEAVEKTITEMYKGSVGDLTDLYVIANGLGVDDDTLVAILVKNLPSELHLTLHIQHA